MTHASAKNAYGWAVRKQCGRYMPVQIGDNLRTCTEVHVLKEPYWVALLPILLFNLLKWP